METIVIGEGDFTLHDVANAIEKSTSFAILQTRWREFAGHIGINEAELPGLELAVGSRTLQLKEVPRKLLKIWKADKGTRATLEVLCKALDECHLSDITVVYFPQNELLNLPQYFHDFHYCAWGKFSPVVGGNLYALELYASVNGAGALKTKFCSVQPGQQIEISLQDKVYTLDQLFETNVPEQILQLFKSYFRTHSDTGPIQIIRREVWSFDLPLYYIPRTLSERIELDETIFSAYTTKEHTFLVKGALKPELARACGFKPIERSGNQLDEVTVQHILLECDDDFDEICRKTTKPVHMIEYKDNSFFHLKSSRGMDKIRAFVKENGISFGENEAVEITTKLNSPSALSIADSPGMGKTYVLGKLLTLVHNQDVTTLFIVLQEIAQNLSSSNTRSASSVIQAISNYAATNNVAKIILQEMLTNNNFFLFLDGYDEVMQHKLHLIDSLLHALNSLPNIKMIVTTRPHLKSRLENILQRLSFLIRPFNESNQIEFLTKYWSNEHGASNGEMLYTFAKMCLESLEMKMTDTEKDIAGIPLQCLMLAEVYAKQAIRASKLKSLPDDVVKITSFFEMYKLLFEIKFSRIGNSEELRQKFFNAHIHDAIILLFPDWLEKFQHLLSPRNEVDETMMYSIGLIEKSPSTNTPRFLHRTFAENLLAQFIVWNLGKSETCVEFLCTKIFGEFGTTTDKKLRNDSEILLNSGLLYELKHPVIAYFVEMQLRDRGLSYGTNLELMNGTDDVNICNTINICCWYDLENCFDLFWKTLRKMNIKGNLKLMQRYFKHLPLVVTENTENVSLLKKVLNCTKLEFEVSLDWHVCISSVFPNFHHFTCTPLHMAVYHGKYNMVIYLLQEYGRNVLLMEYLMHYCLIGSAKNKDSVIEEKLSIIHSLTKVTRKWLGEEIEGRNPILQQGAHVTLIKCLVQFGIDINTCSQKFETVLHTGGDKRSYADLVDWALKNGFKLINRKDKEGKTPLMKAMIRFGQLDDFVLQLFYDAGANFNAHDDDGDSVLFHAIQWTKSVEFVEKILDFGSGVSHRNFDGQNAAHKVIFREDDHFLALKLLKLLVSKGFQGLDVADKFGNTPFKLALTRWSRIDVLLKYFIDAGADQYGNSVLFYSIHYKVHADVIEKILNLGENVNHKNTAGKNAGHFVTTYNGYDPIRALKLLKLLESGGFNGLHKKDCLGNTPVMLAIASGTMNDELLRYFVKAGADEDGNSVLFYALQYAKDTNLIQQLLDIGVSVNHRNKNRENVAHIVIRHQNHNPLLALYCLERLNFYGFTGYNQMNSRRQTPLGLAKKLRVKNKVLLNYLKDTNSLCSIQ